MSRSTLARGATAVAAATLLVLSLVAAPTGASASPAEPELWVARTDAGVQSHCSSGMGALCVWTQANPIFFGDEQGSGTHATYYSTNNNWHVLNAPWSTLANNDRHWCNFGSSGRSARVSQFTNHGGAWHQLLLGWCQSHFGSSWPGRAGSSNNWPWPSAGDPPWKRSDCGC
jgi:hypothetical protein